jgi:hypothetical protein
LLKVSQNGFSVCYNKTLAAPFRKDQMCRPRPWNREKELVSGTDYMVLASELPSTLSVGRKSQ